MSEDHVYLQHILEAIGKIELYTNGIDEETFMADSMRQDAVVRQLEIIGEATKRLLPVTRQSSQEIPWSDVAGMRDVLIHDYMGVDLDQVWAVVQQDVPVLRRAVERLLS